MNYSSCTIPFIQVCRTWKERKKANLNHQLKRIDSAGNPINMALVKLSLEWEQECVSIRKEQA